MSGGLGDAEMNPRLLRGRLGDGGEALQIPRLFPLVSFCSPQSYETSIPDDGRGNFIVFQPRQIPRGERHYELRALRGVSRDHGKEINGEEGRVLIPEKEISLTRDPRAYST